MSVNSPQSTKLLYNMLTYFFSSPRLSCVQNLATRQHFLLSKNMNILRSFLVICLLTFLLFPLSIKAFSNQLIKPWIFNQLSPRVLYFVFFICLLPSQDFITVLDLSSSRQTCILESLTITDWNSLSRKYLHNLSWLYLRWTSSRIFFPKFRIRIFAVL